MNVYMRQPQFRITFGSVLSSLLIVFRMLPSEVHIFFSSAGRSSHTFAVPPNFKRNRFEPHLMSGSIIDIKYRYGTVSSLYTQTTKKLNLFIGSNPSWIIVSSIQSIRNQIRICIKKKDSGSQQNRTITDHVARHPSNRHSENGSQNKLDKFDTYCKEWGLEVDTKKNSSHCYNLSSSFEISSYFQFVTVYQ